MSDTTKGEFDSSDWVGALESDRDYYKALAQADARAGAIPASRYCSGVADGIEQALDAMRGRAPTDPSSATRETNL